MSLSTVKAWQLSLGLGCDTGQIQRLCSLMQVAREVGADFWTGGCVWYPTNVWDAQVPRGADGHTSEVMAVALELGLCQTTKRSQELRSVHGSTMYTRWSNTGTSR